MEVVSHSMTRRAAAHDYCRPGTYHITLHVAEGMGCPMGTVVGHADVPNGHSDAPRVELSPVGVVVEHELLTAIRSRYRMAEVQDYVVMPDHLHFLLVVKEPLATASGRCTHLGHVIKGFKYGCNPRPLCPPTRSAATTNKIMMTNTHTI